MNRLVISPKVGYREMGDLVTIYNCGTQEIQTLNETGSLIWNRLAEGLKPAEIERELCLEYTVSAEEAKADIAEFLKSLGNSGFFVGHESEGEVTESDEEGGYDTLLDLELRSIEELIPFAATFETTYQCNERCIHCYMGKGGDYLALDEVKSILDQLAAAGCLFVSFTGGEFFCRRDALEIVEYAAAKHFVIDILTNGTLINEAIADKLASHSVRRAQISLYGANEEVHDRVTRLPGSFKRSLAAINLLRERGMKVEVAYPMMQGNFGQRYEVRSLAEALGCEFSPSPFITARNDGSKDTFAMRITDEQLREFFADKDLAASYAGRKPFEEHQFYFGFDDLREAPPCYSAVNSLAINPEGTVYPCNQFLLPLGSFKSSSLEEIWQSMEATSLRAIRIGELETCAGCDLLRNCSRCPGLALLEGGSLYGPSPENCRATRININP